jgi:dolichyl-phosphate-mannose--protein O-mannosyl transferase
LGVQVTHGSVIKLQHERTKFRLRSHEVPYGSGSQQQSVTGFPGVEDANSFWVRILPSYRNEDTNGSITSELTIPFCHHIGDLINPAV